MKSAEQSCPHNFVFQVFRACRIIKSVSNSQKEVSKKTQRHEQKRRVTKQKSDEKPEK